MSAIIVSGVELLRAFGLYEAFIAFFIINFSIITVFTFLRWMR
jgi:hypothetical protein